MFEVAVAHLEAEPADPREQREAVTAEYAWALLRALEKDPEQRPRTTLAYAHLLLVSTPEGEQ